MPSPLRRVREALLGRVGRGRDTLRTRFGRFVETLREEPREAFDRYWYLWVGGLVAALQVHVTLRVRAGLAATERVVLADSVIFEFIGLHLARGGRLYETIWELKPPVPFEFAWALAAVAPDVYTYHALALGLNVAAIVVGAVAAAGIVREVTDDTLAGSAAALTPFALPRFWWRATIGLKAKYLVAGLALLALYCHVRDREEWSAVASTLSVGTWQLAAIVPLATFLGTAARRDRRALARYALAALGTAFLVFLPVLWWGTLPEMVVETVFVPLLGTEDGGSTGPVERVVNGLGVALPIAVVGLFGLVASLWADPEDRRRTLPVLAVALWFLLALLFLDYDTRNDLIPFVAVLGVGVGLVVGRARQRTDTADESPISLRGAARVAVVLLVCGMALTSVATVGGYGSDYGVGDPAVYDTTREVDLTMPYNLTERQRLYWEKLEAPTCRVFVGRTQYKLVKRLNLDEGMRYWEPACGQWDPTWRAVREQFGLVPGPGDPDGVLTPTPSPTPTPAATVTPTDQPTPPTLTPLPEPGNETATPTTTAAPTPA